MRDKLNSYQWSQHKSFEEHAKPVFCVFHLIRVSQKSLYPNHRGITQANFFEALAMITFYDSSCISTPLSSSWNLLVRWHPEHAAVTQLISLCKPRLASNFWPWWAQHVRTRRTTIVPQPAEHWRRQASLEAVCAPTELPDENSSNQSLQAGYKLPQLLNPKVHSQTHVLQDSDKTKRGCPQGNWNNGTVENFRGRCPQHQLAEDKKFEEGGVNSWGISSDTLYFERELRSCLLGR